MSSSNKDYHILSGFYLKIIGMVAMVLDHIAVFYNAYHASIPNYDVNVYLALKIIGRISFVIFAFLTVEGVRHSRKPWLYLLQLLGLAIIVDLGYFIFAHEYVGNPITTLFLGGLIVYLLENKKWYIKIIALLPFALSLLMGLDIITFIKSDYTVYGIILIPLFYLGELLAEVVIKSIIKQYSLDEETFMNSSYARTIKNAVPIVLFITYALIIYFINPIWNGHELFADSMYIQVYAIFGMIPLIFYNGKRGYNKPWFKYSCYAFFPIHLIILYLIFNFLI